MQARSMSSRNYLIAAQWAFRDDVLGSPRPAADQLRRQHYSRLAASLDMVARGASQQEARSTISEPSRGTPSWTVQRRSSEKTPRISRQTSGSATRRRSRAGSAPSPDRATPADAQLQCKRGWMSAGESCQVTERSEPASFDLMRSCLGSQPPPPHHGTYAPMSTTLPAPSSHLLRPQPSFDIELASSPSSSPVARTRKLSFDAGREVSRRISSDEDGSEDEDEGEEPLTTAAATAATTTGEKAFALGVACMLSIGSHL